MFLSVCRRNAESNRPHPNLLLSKFVVQLGACVCAIICAASWFSARLAEGQEEPEVVSAKRVDELATRLVTQLLRANVRKVAIFDLQTFDYKQAPLGKWLADRISEDVAKSGGGIEVGDRARLSGINALSEDDTKKPNKICASTAKSVEADAYVGGSFGAIASGIGITLKAYGLNGHLIEKEKWAADTATALLPLDDAVKSHLGVPVEFLRPSDGIFKPGVAGVSAADCTYCPQPNFTDEALRNKKAGTVVLEAVITPDGRATEISVSKPAGFGLDEAAVGGVRTWKFKPAHGPDDAPIAVRQMIEITFRFY